MDKELSSRKDGSQKYAYWLHHLPGVGDKTIRRLLDRYKHPAEIYKRLKKEKENNSREASGLEGILTEKQEELLCIHTKRWKLEEEYEKLEKAEIRFLTFQDSDYPRRLKEIPDPPYAIYVKGELPGEHVLSVAVIGARECSEYGRFVGQELGKALGESGIQVISGMARGIDGISQAAALEAGGVSYGVLGCGVDICYPSQNRKLYDRLLEQGGILSPYVPGTLPKAPLFPPRNRIVSGLADVLVVVEARQKSGTLITVDMALEQGREVYVVPGRLTDRLSDGCNRLVKQGAGVLLSPEDFLKEMTELFPEKLIPGRQAEKKQLQASAGNGRVQLANPCFENKEEEKIYACLELTPKTVEQLLSESGTKLSYLQVQQILMKQQITGQVKQPSPGFYCLRR